MRHLTTWGIKHNVEHVRFTWIYMYKYDHDETYHGCFLSLICQSSLQFRELALRGDWLELRSWPIIAMCP